MINTLIQVATKAEQEMVDITSSVAREVGNSGVKEGSCLLFVPHTTCGIVLNENADPDVKEDIITALNALIPMKSPAYKHGEGNSAAHVKSILTGNSVLIPIRGSVLTLGTWQGIFLCEFDGPRNRSVFVRIE